jgi:hypothetical protein
MKFPGLIPLGILTYGLVARSRTALIIGGVWVAADLLFSSSSPSPPSTGYVGASPGSPATTKGPIWSGPLFFPKGQLQ